MRIHSMIATFGKLEQDTLTLQPGLNRIYAPNEWGKSTWCAFLLAMLYGLDTRAKTTKTALADKERYAPWSGAPMSGRIDLNWEGRDITIERDTKGRIPLGSFRAYETATGIDIPELTAANCGQQLLGVEQSVFRRAGFIRLSDLPVTQDDALRSRLNALVTTGDESGDGVRLEQALRDLKNRIRYNRTGLLPQAEARRNSLESRLDELEALASQCKALEERLQTTENQQHMLTLHLQAMRYADAKAAADAAEQAAQAARDAEQALKDRETVCAALPSRGEAEETCRRLIALRQKQTALEEQLHQLPPPPQMPVPKRPFLGVEPEDAAAMAEEDARQLRQSGGRGWMLILGAAALSLAAGGYFLWERNPAYGIPALAAGFLFLILALILRKHAGQVVRALYGKYGSTAPEQWLEQAQEYQADVQAFRAEDQAYRSRREELEEIYQALKEEHSALCGEATIDHTLHDWQQVGKHWDALDAARAEAAQYRSQADTIAALVRPVPAPEGKDTLTLSPTDTRTALDSALKLRQELQNRLSQYQGRMDALGQPKEFFRELEVLNARIAELEKTYDALTLALQTLAQASAELQRRFAPRITKRAQQLLARLTDGRYDRLILSEDFSLRAGTKEEITLHDALWRSDGTVDQLYLALRLAVAEALTPQAPLILDDVLVRFDETRRNAALEILKDISKEKQILLFSCIPLE